MIYQRYSNAKDFYQAAYPVLMRHEAQNALPLGNAVIGNQGGEPDGWRNVKNWYMATISDDNGTILVVAIMTPPFNLTLYELDNIPNDGALHCLCENLIHENLHIPGVTSENSLAERLARMYAERTGMEYTIYKNMRIYVLHQVDHSIPILGQIRKAEQKDLSYLPYWLKAFHAECELVTIDLKDALTDVNRAIANHALYVLEVDEAPVSMASIQREIITGRCIGMVYTPPFYRAKGYASSCVAQVSQLVLYMGYQYASLFTDLANPTSNSIYQKIGYQPICDYNEIAFKDKTHER